MSPHTLKRGVTHHTRLPTFLCFHRFPDITLGSPSVAGRSRGGSGAVGTVAPPEVSPGGLPGGDAVGLSGGAPRSSRAALQIRAENSGKSETNLAERGRTARCRKGRGYAPALASATVSGMGGSRAPGHSEVGGRSRAPRTRFSVCSCRGSAPGATVPAAAGTPAQSRPRRWDPGAATTRLRLQGQQRQQQRWAAPGPSPGTRGERRTPGASAPPTRTRIPSQCSALRPPARCPGWRSARPPPPSPQRRAARPPTGSSVSCAAYRARGGRGSPGPGRLVAPRAVSASGSEVASSPRPRRQRLEPGSCCERPGRPSPTSVRRRKSSDGFKVEKKKKREPSAVGVVVPPPWPRLLPRLLPIRVLPLPPPHQAHSGAGRTGRGRGARASRAGRLVCRPLPPARCLLRPAPPPAFRGRPGRARPRPCLPAWCPPRWPCRCGPEASGSLQAFLGRAGR
jgi:hypothetical protein